MSSSHSASNYSTLTVVQLREKAKSKNLKGYSKLRKAELINLLNENKSRLDSLKNIKWINSDVKNFEEKKINGMTVKEMREFAKIKGIHIPSIYRNKKGLYNYIGLKLAGY
jgi:hypothetical protein